MIAKNAFLGGVIALALAIPTGSVAAEGLSFKQLDPAFQASLQKALTAELLEKLGYKTFGDAAENITVYTDTSDCPKTCNDEVHNGQCFCEPSSDGKCKDGETKTTRGGKPKCKINPDTASVVGGGSGGSPLEVQMP